MKRMMLFIAASALAIAACAPFPEKGYRTTMENVLVNTEESAKKAEEPTVHPTVIVVPAAPAPTAAVVAPAPAPAVVEPTQVAQLTPDTRAADALRIWPNTCQVYNARVRETWSIVGLMPRDCPTVQDLRKMTCASKVALAEPVVRSTTTATRQWWRLRCLPA